MNIRDLRMSLWLAYVLTSFLSIGGVSADLVFLISPDKCMSTVERTVHFSCAPGVMDTDQVKEITSMKLSKNDQSKPIAFLGRCGNITYGQNVETRFEAEGNYAGDIEDIKIAANLRDPKIEDTGTYTCTMFYLDATGNMKQEVASRSLVVEKLDVKSLEITLNDLRNKIASVEMKVTYASAFSVGSGSSHMQFSSGDVLILPEVIMNVGQGYDQNTGVFTVPRDGVYSFHVAVVAKNMGSAPLSLEASGKVLGRLYAWDQGYWDQTSISVIADLRVGDNVSTIVGSNSYLHNNQYTLFSGSLLTLH